MKKNISLAVFLICLVAPLAGEAPKLPALSADEIMARVFARDSMRESMGGGYLGSREYVLENQKFNKRAQMLVSVSCDPDGTKHFQVVSEEGWKGANKHVLRKMLQSESETSLPDSRPRTRLVPENYEFDLVGSDLVEGRPAYVIDAAPKRADKYLFRGRVWVDAEDFAVVRVQGKPAKNPSFWTRSVDFVQQYQKNGAFWFPRSTTSVTEAHIFGTTTVSIRYFDYRPASEPARADHPDHTDKVMEAHYVQH